MEEKLLVYSLSNVMFRDYNTKKLLAYFPEIRANNFAVEASSSASTGGRGDLALVAFNENYNVSLSIDSGNISLWTLKALTNGIVTKEVKEVTDTLIFRGRTVELPYAPISVEVYKFNDIENKLSVDTYTLNDKNLTINSESEFSSEEFLVSYVFEAEVLNITISESQNVPLYTIHANVELQSDNDRDTKKMYVTIPKARIENVFRLLMANMNGGSESHSLNIEAMRDKREKGLAVIQLLD